MNPSHRRLALAAVALYIGFAPGAALAAKPEKGDWYDDGPRHVDVVRRGPSNEPAVAAAPGLSGRWTAIELAYADRAPVRAMIDETAIVTLDPGAETALEGQGVELIRPLMPSLGMWLVRDTTGVDGLSAAVRLRAPALRARGVRAAVPNLYVRMRTTSAFTPDDPRFSGQWYFQNLHMQDAWGLSQGSSSSTILVIDTGCDLTHKDLAAKMDPGLDVIDDDTDPSPSLSEKGSAHGTSCAGLVGAVTDNGEGIAGGCPACRLSCVRLVNGAALPISKNVQAFQFALDIDAAVVSNSWGFVDPLPVPKELADAINQVFDHGRGGKGAPVVFAVGNDGRTVGTNELLGVRGVLGVGAINNFDESTPFTNSGDVVDIVAPTGTLTTDITGAAGEDPSDYTSLFGGTSSACPVVAGIMGLLVGAAPDKTAQELYDIVIQTTRDAPFAVPDSKGHDPTYGYGIVDPVAALDVALGLSTGTGGAGGAGGGKSSSKAASSDGCSCALANGDSGEPLAALLGVSALGAAFARRRRVPRSSVAFARRL